MDYSSRLGRLYLIILRREGYKKTFLVIVEDYGNHIGQARLIVNKACLHIFLLLSLKVVYLYIYEEETI